jgi:hypothetical protein
MGEGGGYMRDVFRGFLSEFWSSYLVATIAVPGMVWTRQFTGHSELTVLYGAVLGGVFWATSYIFHQMAWFVTTNLLITSWFSRSSLINMPTMNFYFWMLVAQIGAWFVGATTLWALWGGNLDAAAGLAKIDDFWVIFFYETVGMTLMNQIYIMGSSINDNMWKYTVLSATYAILVGAFAATTGGTFNFAWVLTFQIILGVYSWTVVGASLAATFASAVVAVVLQKTIWNTMPSTSEASSSLIDKTAGR